MKFTLFTPVFNRKSVLHRVWNSVQAQTYRNFEWLCIDDGSTDDSNNLLEEYQRSANFPMTVIRLEKNSGKHVAWNKAVFIAKGELFVPCDSDDEFDPDTLEFLARQWDALSECDRSGASGINILCRDAVTKHVVGTAFPDSPLWSNNLELVYRYKITGEKWGCIRTDLLRGIPFPLVQGYYPESYLWFTLARNWRVLCLNRSLRTYYRDQSNQLSSRLPKKERLPAIYDYSCWHLRENWDFIRLRPVRLLGEGSNVFMRAYLLGRSTTEVLSRLRGVRAYHFWPLFAVVGWIRYQRLTMAINRATKARGLFG